jgi:hypothetical protein
MGSRTCRSGPTRPTNKWGPYERISIHLKRAIVAAEDAKFLELEGFDVEGIQAAVEKDLKKGKLVAAAPPSASSSPRTCSCPASAASSARGRKPSSR